MADERTETDDIDETVDDDQQPEETVEHPDIETPEGNEQADTFDREYVEKLRQENGKYRQRAQRADGLAKRLHTELVRATGRLADPSDLAFDEAHLDDEVALSVAIDRLLTAKPHLASRRPVGDIGQGATGATSETVDLAAMLRARA